jgi:hypothetical protein
MTILFLITFNYFSGDFDKIKEKLNHEKEILIEKYINEYDFNKCDTQGNLPALQERCRNLKKKIILNKKDTLSYLSIMVVLIIDSIDYAYRTVDTKLFSILVLIMFILRKF